MVIKLQLNCIAASLFQRCVGGLQRPIFMQHYGFSAVLVDFSAPLLCSIAAPAPLWWILTHQSGSSATRVHSSASFLCKIWVPPSQEWFPAIHFFAFSRFNAALADSSDQSIAAPAPHGWTPAPQAYATCVNNDRAPKTQANNCCVAAWQPARKDKERRLSPLNEPVDSFNFAMIFRYGFPYGHPLTVDPIVWAIFIVFCELKCNKWFKGI